MRPYYYLQDATNEFSIARNMIVGLLLSTFVINILALAFPLALLQVYDRIIPNAAYSSLVTLVMIVLLAVVLETILRICRTVMTAWTDSRFEHLMGTDIFDRMINACLKSFEKNDIGGYLDRINSFGSLKDFYGGQAVCMLIDLPFVVIFIALISYLGNDLVLVPVTILGLYILTASYYSKKINDKLHEQRDSQDQRLNFIIEMITGIHTIKSHGMESLLVRRYERLLQGSTRRNYDLSVQAASALASSAFFSQVTLVLVVAFGSIKVVNGDITIGVLAACTLLSGRILQPVGRVMSLIRRLQSIRVSEQRLQDIHDLKADGTASDVPFPSVAGDIELRGVTFKYDGSETDLFTEVNLTIKQGSCVAIEGASSAGKSTLLQIMFGLTTPNAGQVFIDKEAIDEYKIETYRRQISYLQQDPVFMSGTILENLTMFRPVIDKHKIEAVTGSLGLDEMIKNLPLGYDTLIGNKTIEFLSLGVMQRFAIARALISGSKIILFDEANSGVDLRGDQYVKNALKSVIGERTLVLVTQRRSILDLAEKSYLLSNAGSSNSKMAGFLKSALTIASFCLK